ncbi:MAG: GTPase [bacterium]
MSHPEPQIFVTRLTADAPGAIGVVRVWGPGAVALADRLFEPKLATRPLANTAPGRPRLGRFAGDEVVALILPESPNADALEVEIQCHGSPLVVCAIIDKLVEAGAAEAAPTTFQQAHGVKWLERLALEHVGLATSPKAVLLLWQQYAGALRHGLMAILQEMQAGRLTEARSLLGQLQATGGWATRLSTGFRVALTGPPNVGKSSLANALAGFERVVVSPEPGTTRDVVEVRLTIDGWPVILTDTAGLRQITADPLEEAGMALARQEHARADLVLKLAEATSGNEFPFSEDWPATQKQILVLTKADLVDQSQMKATGEGLFISAVTGHGLDNLMQLMISTLIPADFPQDTAPAQAILFDEKIMDEMQFISEMEPATAISHLTEILDRF